MMHVLNTNFGIVCIYVLVLPVLVTVMTFSIRCIFILFYTIIIFVYNVYYIVCLFGVILLHFT